MSANLATNGRLGYTECATKVDVCQSFSEHLLVDRKS